MEQFLQVTHASYFCVLHSRAVKLSVWYAADQSSRAFKEVVILRHPRIGEYAIGFITSTVILRGSSGDEELSCVYVPTNNLYLGDIFFFNSMDVIRPNLSVREGIGKRKSRIYASKLRLDQVSLWSLLMLGVAEIVLSGGMSIPPVLSTRKVKDTLEEEVRILQNPKLLSVKD